MKLTHEDWATIFASLACCEYQLTKEAVPGSEPEIAEVHRVLVKLEEAIASGEFFDA